MSIAQTVPGGREGEDVPAWSGIPVVAGDCLVLPLHISDTRHITFGPQWVHIDQWPNEGGDVEYHVFKRTC